MKPCCLIALLLFAKLSFSQDVSGKWYGKLTQGDGGYAQSYDLELNLNQKKNIWGDSHVYIKDSLSIRIGLLGYTKNDSLYLSEIEYLIFQEKVPSSWIPCIKNFIVNFHLDDKEEILEGRWDGVSKGESSDCIPGRVILARTKNALNEILKKKQDADNNTAKSKAKTNTSTFKTSLNFDEAFKNKITRKVTEIVVNNVDLQFEVLDYMKEDDDTISVYLDREVILSHVKITKQPIFVYFKLNPEIQLHELLLYAENQGKYSPNTSQLVIYDGDNTFRLMIESDEQKTAAVYIRYEPLSNDFHH